MHHVQQPRLALAPLHRPLRRAHGPRPTVTPQCSEHHTQPPGIQLHRRIQHAAHLLRPPCIQHRQGQRVLLLAAAARCSASATSTCCRASRRLPSSVRSSAPRHTHHVQHLPPPRAHPSSLAPRSQQQARRVDRTRRPKPEAARAPGATERAGRACPRPRCPRCHHRHALHRERVGEQVPQSRMVLHRDAWSVAGCSLAVVVAGGMYMGYRVRQRVRAVIKEEQEALESTLRRDAYEVRDETHACCVVCTG